MTLNLFPNYDDELDWPFLLFYITNSTETIHNCSSVIKTALTCNLTEIVNAFIAYTLTDASFAFSVLRAICQHTFCSTSNKISSAVTVCRLTGNVNVHLLLFKKKFQLTLQLLSVFLCQLAFQLLSWPRHFNFLYLLHFSCFELLFLYCNCLTTFSAYKQNDDSTSYGA